MLGLGIRHAAGKMGDFNHKITAVLQDPIHLLEDPIKIPQVLQDMFCIDGVDRIVFQRIGKFVEVKHNVGMIFNIDVDADRGTCLIVATT